MANEAPIAPVIETPAPAPVVAPVISPVVEAPVAAVAPPPEAPASVLDTPVAPVVEAPVEPPKEPEKPAETVLAQALETPKEEVKPEAETTEAEAPKVEEAPKPEPVFDAFKLPDDVKLQEDKLLEFTKLLGSLEAPDAANHGALQEFGQKAVEFHVNALKQNAENIQKYMQTAWDKQKVSWKEEFLADPEYGGNRFQTTVDSALTFIRTHGGSPEEQTEFRNLMEVSGLGNNKTMIKILARAGRAMSEGAPLAAQTPLTPSKSKTEALYGNKKN